LIRTLQDHGIHQGMEVHMECTIVSLLKDGDRIELDVQARRLHLHVSDDELARRREQWRPPEKKFDRGYGMLFSAECTQAHEGCDFKFLHPAGKPAPEPDIY